MTAQEILLNAIGAEVCGSELDGAFLSEMNEETLSELFSLAKSYDFAHIVGAALKKANLDVDQKLFSPFYNEHALAVFRYRRFEDELSQITEAFEDAGIDNIALKGSVIRSYYPEPWMRTSCDIDILVKKEELDAACAVLVEKLGYKYMTRCAHDVSYESATGVHLELHFVLMEEYGHLAAFSEVLSGLWERSSIAAGKKHSRIMADEDFYFYHVAHMAKHFLSGGCGIKPFVDLWILENKLEFDSEKRNALLEKGGLLSFAEASRRLIEVWFFHARYDDNIRAFEKYLFHGGNYGTIENGVNISVGKKQGKLAYVISRIFPSYGSMISMYPSLEKRKILLPFYHVRRWFRIIFKGGAKKAVAQISKSSKLTKEEITEMKNLVSYLGLDA